jgi:hypothetical protein
MITRTARTAKSTRSTVVLLGLLSALAASALVYAASAKPNFKLAVSPSRQTVAQGQATNYRISVKRIHGFKGAIKLTVGRLPKGARAIWKLPDGRTLARVRRGASTAVLPKRKKAAMLQIRAGVGTPSGSFRASVKATSGRVKHSKKVTLEVRRPGKAPAPSEDAPGPSADGSSTLPPAQPVLTVVASPASRNLLQGDSTAYSLEISRSGFSGPVTLGASGLPAGATASFSPAGEVEGSTATLTVAAASTTLAGTYELTIIGTGGGVSGAAATALTVQVTKNFSIAGTLTRGLLPGSAGRLDLALTNPYYFDLRVTNLQVTLDDATGIAGCSASANYDVTQLGGAYPLWLHPGTTHLSSLVSAEELPQVRMLDLPTNQDACKGAELAFHYTGAATK